MRMLFSLLALLLVAYVVLQLARSQLQALAPSSAASAAAGASALGPQQQVLDELNKALELGRQRVASGTE